jgi:U3 small nucleolar RNA-associated protein 15
MAEEFVSTFKLDKEEKYDMLLRKFEYSKALDSVLSRYCVNKTPQVTVAVMQELMRRQGLTIAFSNRTQDSLAKIITFFNKYISDSRFTRVLLDVANIFIDTYEKSFLSLTSDVQQLIIELCRRIRVEEELTLEFLKLEGSLEMIMNAAAVGSRDMELNSSTKLYPSENAKGAAVINL